MSHDKISAAARRRMAETGEPYAAARRAVIKQHQAAGGDNPRPGTQWFAISFSDAGFDRLTLWLDTLSGGGPGRSGVEVGSEEIRVRMGGFRQDIPRSSVRSVSSFRGRVGGTTGVHAGRGQLLVNGSTDDLVELEIDPPCYTGRTMSTMWIKERVNSLVVSLADPNGFIAAVQGDRAPTVSPCRLLPDTMERPVPPLSGQQQLPPELSWVLPVPAVDAPARLAD